MRNPVSKKENRVAGSWDIIYKVVFWQAHTYVHKSRCTCTCVQKHIQECTHTTNKFKMNSKGYIRPISFLCDNSGWLFKLSLSFLHKSSKVQPSMENLELNYSTDQLYLTDNIENVLSNGYKINILLNSPGTIFKTNHTVGYLSAKF